MKADVLFLTADDPEPPVGTHLAVGAQTGGDRVSFLRLDAGWVHAYGDDPYRPCGYNLAQYWMPARVVGGPLLAFRLRKKAA